MGIIKLKNVRVYAYHGCLIEESKIGSDYRIDLEVKVDLEESSKTDRLQDTVDYVKLNQIIVDQMKIRQDLLEKVGSNIINTIFNELRTIEKIKLSVAKLNPPIGGDVESVQIVMKEKRKK
jgi:7,8-dihydroneopterin aldolase/epimerase/oxygenase